MRILIVLLFLLTACDDVEKNIHPCDLYGIDNSWCDGKGRSNVCTYDESGKLRWFAQTCGDHWTCNEDLGVCQCQPDEMWCLPHNGLEFRMQCDSGGNFAGGPACYGGCEENDGIAQCL